MRESKVWYIVRVVFDEDYSISHSKRARRGLALLFFGVVFFYFLGFLGGWLRGGRGGCR